jgi:predicted methyltransferase
MTALAPSRLRIVTRALVVAALAVGLVLVLLLVSLRRPSDREVDLLVNALGIRAGATIGEIGAGDGWLSVEVARRVGPSGRVYSTELDTDRLDRIRVSAREAGLSNVTVIEAASQSTNLMPACCDAIFMRRVYHHFDDPRAIVADINRALKPAGWLAIIEFESSGLLGAVTREGIDTPDLIAQVTGGGFELITVDEWPGVNHYVAVFRRAAGSKQ